MPADTETTQPTGQEAGPLGSDLIALAGQYWALRKTVWRQSARLVQLESALALKSAGVLIALTLLATLLAGCVLLGLHALLLMALLGIGLPAVAAILVLLLLDALLLVALGRAALNVAGDVTFAHSRQLLNAGLSRSEEGCSEGGLQ